MYKDYKIIPINTPIKLIPEFEFIAIPPYNGKTDRNDKLYNLSKHKKLDENTSTIPHIKLAKPSSNIIASKGTSAVGLLFLLLTNGYLISGKAMRENGIPILNKREAYDDISNPKVEDFVFTTKLSDEDSLDINIDYALDSTKNNVISQKISHSGNTEKSKQNLTNLNVFYKLLEENLELKQRFTKLSKIPIIYLGRTIDGFIDAEAADIGLGYLSKIVQVKTVLCEKKDKEILLSELEYFPFSISLSCVNDLRKFSDTYIPIGSDITERRKVAKKLFIGI